MIYKLGLFTTLEEVEKGINLHKNKQTVGIDNISLEFFMHRESFFAKSFSDIVVEN